MKKTNFLISLVLVAILVFAQVSSVFAAPAFENTKLISGIVQRIDLGTDTTTGITTVIVTVKDEKGKVFQLRISAETAALPEFGLVTLDGSGNLLINELALGQEIVIDSGLVIEGEKLNPVGNALSTFFSDIEDLDYEAIMNAHDLGNGFGVIAQALWLTRKLGGTVVDFSALLDAKKTNDFSAYVLVDGSSPKSWEELKKAIMDGDKQGNLGLVMSSKNDKNNGNKDKDKSKNNDKGNNGGGNDNKKP
jgi:hypothetical protein